MTIPNVNITVEDGGLGVVPPSSGNVVLKVGAATQGPTNEIESFTRLEDLQSTFGSGPLVEAAALSLAKAGGPVLCCRATTSTPGAAGAVTAGSGNTGTGDMTVAGAANDEYDVVVTLTQDGLDLAAKTAAFKYSLDGGVSTSAEIAVPSAGAYVIPGTGLTLTFADGASGTSFKTGDTFTFTTTAPTYSLTNLQTAMTAALADPREWGVVHVVGAAADVSGAAAMASALDTILEDAATNFRYARGMIELPADTDANLLAGFLNTTSKRVMACASTESMTSAISALVETRSSAWSIAARIAKVPLHEDLGWTERGALDEVTAIDRNEEATPGLDGRFATLRTVIGKSGFYITSGRMLAAAGSDFSLIQNCRVMDEACRVARIALLPFMNASLVLQDETGKNPGAVTEKQARAIETAVNSELASAIGSHCTKAYAVVDRTHDVDTDATLPVTIRIQPFGYSRFIDASISFENPALTAAA